MALQTETLVQNNCENWKPKPKHKLETKTTTFTQVHWEQTKGRNVALANFDCQETI